MNRVTMRNKSRLFQGNPVDRRYVLAGGSMLALVGVLVDLHEVPQPVVPPSTSLCQEKVQHDSNLSRDELARLLNIPELSRKATVQQVIREPFCRLSPVEIRAGIVAERDAYPLEFAPQTWFVVLYEGDEYAGYSFVLPQEVER